MNCSRNFFFFFFLLIQPVNFSRQLLFWGWELNWRLLVCKPWIFTCTPSYVSWSQAEKLTACCMPLEVVRGPSSLAHMSVFSVSKNTQKRASTISGSMRSSWAERNHPSEEASWSGPERTKCGLGQGLFFASNQQQLGPHRRQFHLS